MIKIYVADLSSYNSGYLVGAWLELPMDEDEIQERIQAILREGEKVDKAEGIYTYEHEEYAIHDWECEISGIEIGEYSNITSLNEMAERLEDLADWELRDVEAVMYANGCHLDEALDIVNDGRYTIFSGVTTTEELGQYVLDEGLFGIDVPDDLLSYIDTEAIGRDWGFDYTIIPELNLAIHVD